MSRGSYGPESDSSALGSTTRSEAAFMDQERKSFKSVSTISTKSMKTCRLATNPTSGWTEISRNETKRSKTDLTVFDIADQSSPCHALFENKIYELERAITSELRQITKRMDELQKKNEEEKKDFEIKPN